MSIDQVENAEVNTENQQEMEALMQEQMQQQMMQAQIFQVACALASNNIFWDICKREGVDKFKKKSGQEKPSTEQELRLAGYELGLRASMVNDGMIMGIETGISLFKQAMEDAKKKLLVPPEKKLILPGNL